MWYIPVYALERFKRVQQSDMLCTPYYSQTHDGGLMLVALLYSCVERFILIP